MEVGPRPPGHSYIISATFAADFFRSGTVKCVTDSRFLFGKIGCARGLRLGGGGAFYVGVKTPSIIELRGVSRAGDETDDGVGVEDVSLVVSRGDVIALTGDTRGGRNLLLRLIGLTEAPDAGEVYLEGEPTAQLTDDVRIELRNQRCGYLFTAPFLLPAFNVAENIAMPLFKISQLTPEQARDRTEALLRFVGLDSASKHHDLPQKFQHRVALCRALANHPVALFVEDFDSLLPAEDLPEFRMLLHSVARDLGIAVVFTAPPSLPVREGERRLEIVAGRIVCGAPL